MSEAMVLIVGQPSHRSNRRVRIRRGSTPPFGGKAGICTGLDAGFYRASPYHEIAIESR